MSIISVYTSYGFIQDVKNYFYSDMFYEEISIT